MTVRPCEYPGCDNGHGDPRLTGSTFCDPCRRRHRKHLDWIVLDYVTLKATMPKPVFGAGQRRSSSVEPGHPAEWASDTARQICEILNGAEDALRDHLHHEPAPHNHMTGQEARLVEHAYTYLAGAFDHWCTYPGAHTNATEIADIHRTVRHRLGYTRDSVLLPTPCPHCDTAAMTRSVDPGNDRIECANCGILVKEAEYDWFALVLLDQVIDTYDTPPVST